MAEELQNNMVYGKNAVTSLLKSGKEVDSVLVSSSVDGKIFAYYKALALQAGAVIKQIPPEKLDALCPGVSHQGVAASMAEIVYASLDEILDKAEKTGKAPFVLICDGIEDPHNFGALIRSALLCGVDGVVIPKRGQAFVTPVVMKASAGAAALMPVARVANIGEAVRRLKSRNVFVYGADMGGMPAAKTNLKGAVALVLGNEGRGLSSLVKKLCDGIVSIDMAENTGGVDSFNVSVAGGIIMHEIFCQNSVKE